MYTKSFHHIKFNDKTDGLGTVIDTQRTLSGTQLNQARHLETKSVVSFYVWVSSPQSLVPELTYYLLHGLPAWHQPQNHS